MNDIVWISVKMTDLKRNYGVSIVKQCWSRFLFLTTSSRNLKFAKISFLAALLVILFTGKTAVRRSQLTPVIAFFTQSAIFLLSRTELKRLTGRHVGVNIKNPRRSLPLSRTLCAALIKSFWTMKMKWEPHKAFKTTRVLAMTLAAPVAVLPFRGAPPSPPPSVATLS